MLFNTFNLVACVAATAVSFMAPSVSALGEADTAILNYALTLENLEANFYQTAMNKFTSPSSYTDAGYDAGVYNLIKLIAADEAQHVSYLIAALGANATTECQYNFDAALVDVATFLATAQSLEATGVKAYLGASSLLTNALFQPAATIATIEARHTAALSQLTKMRITEGPFDTAIGQKSIVSVASGLISGACPAVAAYTPYPALKTTLTATQSAQSASTITLNSTVTNATFCLFAFGNITAHSAYTGGVSGTCQLPVTVGYTNIAVWLASSDVDYVAANDILNGSQTNILAGPLFLKTNDDNAYAGYKTNNFASASDASVVKASFALIAVGAIVAALL